MQQAPIGEFTFHNAGQGLFYSGNVSGFEFIYDCGSDRKQHLNDIILDYKNNLKNSTVNLLIISHLHEDHVSGLHTLFHNKPKTHVNQVILPYLSPIERLILAIQASAPGSLTGQWYYNFLANPVGYFLENGVETVTYLGNYRSGNLDRFYFDRRENNESSDFPEINQTKDFVNKLRDSPDLMRTIFANEPCLSGMSRNRLKVKSHDGFIQLSSANQAYWLFRFYNYSVDPAIVLSFQNSIKNMIGSTDITNVITDECKRGQLRSCYKQLFGKSNFNNTSLLALHGPITPKSKSFQLLTGDINFKLHVSEIATHFSTDLSKVGVCLIPHHGSIRNWDNLILKKVASPCRWVVSSGKGNKTQPHSVVLNEIRGYGHDYAICDDDCKLIINFPGSQFGSPLSVNSSIAI